MVTVLLPPLQNERLNIFHRTRFSSYFPEVLYRAGTVVLRKERNKYKNEHWSDVYHLNCAQKKRIMRGSERMRSPAKGQIRCVKTEDKILELVKRAEPVNFTLRNYTFHHRMACIYKRTEKWTNTNEMWGRSHSIVFFYGGMAAVHVWPHLTIHGSS